MGDLVHAIVGCGRVAPNHADAFSRLSGVRLAYAVDPDIERARRFAEEYGIETAVESLDQVLADPRVTSVSLCTPHDLHAPQILAAVGAGKHVLVEKPFVLGARVATTVASAAADAGVTVMPVAQHRFDPLIVSIGSMVAEGKLGQLVLARGHLECQRPLAYYAESDWRGSWAREGGSVLINQAYHIVELLRWLAGPVRSVKAHMATLRHPEAMETEDTIAASLQLENGGIGALSVTGAGGSQWRSHIELIGTTGEVAFDIGNPNGLHRFQLADKRAMRAWRQQFEQDLQAGSDAEVVGVDYYGISHRQQAVAFVARTRGEDDCGSATLEHAIAVVELIDRIYASAKSGETA